jgi:hypothetical protein
VWKNIVHRFEGKDVVRMYTLLYTSVNSFHYDMNVAVAVVAVVAVVVGMVEFV